MALLRTCFPFRRPAKRRTRTLGTLSIRGPAGRGAAAGPAAGRWFRPGPGLGWGGGPVSRGPPAMRVDFYGLTFETPCVTFYLWSPWRSSALEHKLFEAVRA